MITHTTVFARSKEIETLVTDALSVEELVSGLRSLTVTVESFCLSPTEEELCRKRFDQALKRARIDSELFEYSAEGMKTTSARILSGLQEIIQRILFELSVFWSDSFGHAKRLRRVIDEHRSSVSRLRVFRPKALFVTNQFTITRVLSPLSPLLKVPTDLASELVKGNRAVLRNYSSSLNQWLVRLKEDDSLPPAPNFPENNVLPGTPVFYSRDPQAIVWGIRYQTPKVALDPTKSQMEVATRDQLLNLCDSVYDALELTINYQREWHNTERGLKKIINDLKATGSEGYEVARARKLALAAAALPRQWARYGLYLCAQLTRYIEVCLEQYD